MAVPWRDFEDAAPDLARSGRDLLYQFGPGLAFLATVRADGGPRLHPVCPVIVEGVLYVYVIPSPKCGDLLRDGRYALHAFPPENVDDEFYITGRAYRVDDTDRRTAVSRAIAAQGTTHGNDDILFDLSIERVLHAAYTHRGPDSWPPAYRRWHPGEGGIDTEMPPRQ